MVCVEQEKWPSGGDGGPLIGKGMSIGPQWRGGGRLVTFQVLPIPTKAVECSILGFECPLI